MGEYKQSLITAAVAGDLDVTTAGSGLPGLTHPGRPVKNRPET